MRKVESLVAKAVGKPEVVRAARAWVVMHRWEAVVGEGLASRSTPDRYDRGTVWVAVKGSEWAQELRLMKEDILARLNAEAKERLFTDVRFGVRAAKPKPRLMSVEPKPAPEAPAPDWREGLSILEIARLRLTEHRPSDDRKED